MTDLDLNDHSAWSVAPFIAEQLAETVRKEAWDSRLLRDDTGRVDPIRKLASGRFTSIPDDYDLAEPDSDGVWITVKSAQETPVSTLTRPVTDTMGLTESWWNSGIGGPTPLVSALAGGLLVAGGGYLAGRAAENIFPESVIEPGRLRRNMAMLGAGAGVLPSVYLASLGSRVRPHGSFWKSWVEPNVLFGSDQHADPKVTQACMTKMAQIGGVADGNSMFVPSIPVDHFNRVILTDPFLPSPMAFATAGLVSAADMFRGSTGIISPFDLTRMAIGMGAGLTQAYLGGKLLGAVAGLSPDAQRRLQQAGVIAGAVKASVPGMFGRP
jgi:hypothetical protein